jgi:hypothetical protein
MPSSPSVICQGVLWGLPISCLHPEYTTGNNAEMLALDHEPCLGRTRLLEKDSLSARVACSFDHCRYSMSYCAPASVQVSWIQRQGEDLDSRLLELFSLETERALKEECSCCVRTQQSMRPLPMQEDQEVPPLCVVGSGDMR